MPTLKQLTCHIERGPTNSPLHEYATEYGDGVVTTYLAVPNKPTPFKVHLTSQGFIAHGLAMFVFIDGKAQCNRNSRGLVIPQTGVDHAKTEVDFQVNQKEVKSSDGVWIARPWKFEKLNIAEADSTPEVGEHVKWDTGTIEVIVLRCDADSQNVSATDPLERRPPSPKPEPKTTPLKSAMKRSISISLENASKLQPLPTRKMNTVTFDLPPDPISVTETEILPPTTEVVAPEPPQQYQLPPLSVRKHRRGVRVNLCGSLLERPADEGRASLKPIYSVEKTQRHGMALVRRYERPDKDEDNGLGLPDQMDGTSDTGPPGIVINQFSRADDGQKGGGSTRRRNREYTASYPDDPHWQHLQPAPPLMPTHTPMLVYPQMSVPHGHTQMPYQVQHLHPYYALPPGFGPSNTYPSPHAQAHHPIEPGSRQASGQSRSSGNMNNGSWNANPGSQPSNRKSSGSQRNGEPQGNNNWNNDGSNVNDNTGWGNDNHERDDNFRWNSDNNDGYGKTDWDNNDGNGGNENTDWNNGDAAAGGWGDDKASQKNDWEPASNNGWESSAKNITTKNGTWADDKSNDNTWADASKENSNNAAWDATPATADPSINKSKSRTSTAAAKTTNMEVYLPRRRAITHGEDPISPSPAAAASQGKLSHALQHGPSSTWEHRDAHPRYLDSMDRPYAVFRFKYRSGDRLLEILGEGLAEKENKINRGRYKEKMLTLSKEQVLAELLRAKRALQYGSDSSIDDDEGVEEDSDDAQGDKPVATKEKSGKAEKVTKAEEKTKKSQW